MLKARAHRCNLFPLMVCYFLYVMALEGAMKSLASPWMLAEAGATMLDIPPPSSMAKSFLVICNWTQRP